MTTGRRIIAVVGARPNFMKMAPVIGVARSRGLEVVMVHTGQHYDEKMSQVFFDQLGMPKPEVHLGVGSGSHAEQTAKVLVGFEAVLRAQAGDVGVVVAGDVNSTLACALAAAKLHIPVAHVESGLRSFDRTMPEELNRVMTDHISDVLLCTEPSGVENLAREGITRGVHLVGNSMIDSLVLHRARAEALAPWHAFGAAPQNYALVTLHRPSNVDDDDAFAAVAGVLRALARDMRVIFPAHPRTIARARAALGDVPSLTLCEPLGYLEFLGLMAGAKVVVTDSGGIQEETTALGVQCVTLRNNTERPITVQEGTNTLVAVDERAVLAEVARGPRAGARVPALWDGKAAERIVDVLVKEWT